MIGQTWAAVLNSAQFWHGKMIEEDSRQDKACASDPTIVLWSVNAHAQAGRQEMDS